MKKNLLGYDSLKRTLRNRVNSSDIYPKTLTELVAAYGIIFIHDRFFANSKGTVLYMINLTINEN